MEAQALIDLAREGAPLERQREALGEFLRASGVSAAGADAVLARTRDGVGLFPGNGKSRLGGEPLLPPGEGWPHAPDGRHLDFIAALDFGDLPDLDPLPASGLLLVYWDTEFHELERMDFVAATRVFFLPDGGAVAADRPKDVEPLEAVSVEGFLMPLNGEADRVDAPDADEDVLYEAADELVQARPYHQLLGSSNDIQGPVLEEVSYWFEQGFPETRERYDEAERRGEGWILLAQFSEFSDVVFGDAGALYLIMPEADLRAARFDRVMGIMQN